MKPAFFILFLITSTLLLAQVPQGFNYQAVVRNAAGEILPHQRIGLKINLRSGSETGPVVYSEQQSDSTNAFGLMDLVVGQGTPVSGSFGSIAWASGTYFMEELMDATGGSNYQPMGAARLLSVPYAMYAGRASGIDVYDSVRRTRIRFDEGEITNELGTSRGVYSKLNNDTLEWGFQATYTPDAKSVMLYFYDTISHTNQVVQLNPDNVAVRSRDGQGHETQLRIKADAGISILTDTLSAQYFLPQTPPVDDHQVLVSDRVGLEWRTTWANWKCDTIFRPLNADVVFVAPNCYNIISPATPLQVLILQLPLFARDGDILEMKFEHTIGTLYYAGGTMSRGALTTVDLSVPYQKFVFKSVDGIWH